MSGMDVMRQIQGTRCPDIRLNASAIRLRSLNSAFYSGVAAVTVLLLMAYVSGVPAQRMPQHIGSTAPSIPGTLFAVRVENRVVETIARLTPNLVTVGQRGNELHRGAVLALIHALHLVWRGYKIAPAEAI
jgi:biotin synthase-related radical SAM superfamily protein